MQNALSSLVLAAVILGTRAVAAPCPPRASWPTTEWPRQLVDANAKAAQLEALEDYAFTLVGKDAERSGYRTDGLLIIRNGAIVYERYGRGFDETKRHVAFSVTKSVTSVLAGVAVQQGALTVDDSICKHLDGFSGPVCDITLKHLLTFSSGLAWQESYENGVYQQSSVLAMQLGVAHRDQLAHVLTHRIVAAPGERFLYSTGDSTVAAAMVKRALIKKTNDPDAFWTLLFDKIGAPTVVFEEDQKGTPGGGSFAYATPRDLAKFGFLALNDGCWGGERLLPEGWMQASLTPSAAWRAQPLQEDDVPNGYSWWLNQADPPKLPLKPWADAPMGTFAALGHWGQKIIVVPADDVVIVRTGDDREGNLPENQLIKLALEVAR